MPETPSRPPLFETRVYGLPRPQGSLTLYGTNGRGKPKLGHGQPLILWRETCVTALRAALPVGWVPLSSSAAVQLRFYLPRPQRHFTRHGDLRNDAPTYVANGADLDKLVRGVFDALTISGVIADDRHVSLVRAEKVYADANSDAGVQIALWGL